MKEIKLGQRLKAEVVWGDELQAKKATWIPFPYILCPIIISLPPLSSLSPFLFHLKLRAAAAAASRKKKAKWAQMVARVKQKQKNKADQQNTVQLQTKKRRKILNMALHDATCEGRRRRGGCTRQSKKTEGKDGRGKYQERERERATRRGERQTVSCTRRIVRPST